MEKKIWIKFWKRLAVLLFAGICASFISFCVYADGDSNIWTDKTGWVSGKTLDDYDFVKGVISTRITLDSLGDVNLVSFYYNDLHPTLMVVLADDEGNILFNLCNMNGFEFRVFDVFVEDMNGDGWDDVKVILGMYENGWSRYRQIWDCYQMEGGGFDIVIISLPEEAVPISPYKYYGCYRIAEFCPAKGFTAGNQGMMTEQEVDMMLGRTVILDEKLTVLYDCEKKQGVRKGGDVFHGNHMVQRFVVSEGKGWSITPDFVLGDKSRNSIMEQAVGKERYEKINGKICNWDNMTVHFYTMEDTDSLIMESYLSGQYFILEKIEGEEAEKELEKAGVEEYGADEGEVTLEEKEKILADAYGTYTIKEFLPTSYYEGKKDAFLPGGEPEWMIGKKITIGKNIFTTYDNYRWSDVGREKEVGKWFQKVTIQEPDYRLTRRKRWEIFGLRDDMLPEGMEQEEYMEIDVYPGLKMRDDRYLPQLFLLDDGRVLMYSMGQYFLLERTD